jgi:SSS family solute:Na+ symporter
MTVNLLARTSLPAFLQSPINAGAFCMIMGLIIVPVVSAFTPKQDRDSVEKIFSCYEKRVSVPQSEALGDVQDAD